MVLRRIAVGIKAGEKVFPARRVGKALSRKAATVGRESPS
jgi:hypothetical protein